MTSDLLLALVDTEAELGPVTGGDCVGQLQGSSCTIRKGSAAPLSSPGRRAPPPRCPPCPPSSGDLCCLCP